MTSRFRPTAAFASGRTIPVVYGPFRNRSEKRAAIVAMPRQQRVAIASLPPRGWDFVTA